jgi:hypothetical protein
MTKRDPKTKSRYLEPHERPRLRPTFHRDFETPDSKWITLIRYCPRTEIMDVLTVKGERYRYWDVDSEIFSDVVTAKSVGRAFNRSVRNNELISYAQMRVRASKVRADQLGPRVGVDRRLRSSDLTAN